MALINCFECKKRISDRALTCPSCGTPKPNKGWASYEQVNIDGRICEIIKIDNLEIAEYDFGKRMNWEDAEKACNELGRGWRLPNKDELYILLKNHHRIGNFTYWDYWSATEEFMIDEYEEYEKQKQEGLLAKISRVFFILIRYDDDVKNMRRERIKVKAMIDGVRNAAWMMSNNNWGLEPNKGILMKKKILSRVRAVRRFVSYEVLDEMRDEIQRNPR